MDGRVCICLCVPVQLKKLNAFLWNERILMKFSAPVHYYTSIFLGGGVRSTGLKGMALGQKWPVSRKSISPCEFLSYRGMTYLFGNWTKG